MTCMHLTCLPTGASPMHQSLLDLSMLARLPSGATCKRFQCVLYSLSTCPAIMHVSVHLLGQGCRTTWHCHVPSSRLAFHTMIQPARALSPSMLKHVAAIQGVRSLLLKVVWLCLIWALGRMIEWRITGDHLTRECCMYAVASGILQC